MIVKNIHIAPSIDKILLRLGYRGRTLNTADRQIINKSVKKAISLMDPAYVYIDATVRNDISGVLFNEDICIRSKDLQKLLKGSDHATVFFATIGNRLEGFTDDLIKKDDKESFVYDAIATEAVEALADTVKKNTVIRAKKKGFGITPRYSPGYGDLQLSEQRKLYELCNAVQINISLTEEYFMRPLKSISAIIGWYK